MMESKRGCLIKSAYMKTLRTSIRNKPRRRNTKAEWHNRYLFVQSVLLLTAGNLWSPRPVIQSHGAYTPKLARLNELHLLSERAPNNIVFKVEPIDGRLASLEDGLSWPIL